MTADILIKNAKVYTVDDANPHAEVVAVQGNNIVYVGSEADLDQSLISDSTRVIDGGGKTLLPGIIDAHFHLLWGAFTLYGAQLYKVNSLDDLKESLLSWSAENPDAPIIIGQGCTYAIPDIETALNRHHLDWISAEKPIILTAYDQHSCFANTAALKLAGIFENPPKLGNGEIVVGEDGFATGELYEMDAMDAIKSAISDPTFAEQIAMLKDALALCASYGITSVQNMDGDVEQTGIYEYMDERDELSLRVYMPFWVKPEMDSDTMIEQASELREKYKSQKVRGGAVKFFMDGVYESHTAITVNGYADDDKAQGEPIWSAERFAEFATLADRHGFQIAVHACGDGAVRRVLDGYESAQAANGSRDSRHRVEHIEILQDEDVPRFVELGVVASMQPLHSPLGEEYDPDVWLQRVHEYEYDKAFPWNTLREAGAHLAFGSDWPVVTADPHLGIWGAVTRKAIQPGTNSHAQSLEEAIRGYTRDAAYTEFQENVKGQIKVGMLADLVLLSADIFSIDQDALKEVSAELTICDGKVVFEKDTSS